METLNNEKLKASIGMKGYTIIELKDFLRQFNLPLTGSKDEMVRRLKSFLNLDEKPITIDIGNISFHIGDIIVLKDEADCYFRFAKILEVRDNGSVSARLFDRKEEYDPIKETHIFIPIFEKELGKITIMKTGKARKLPGESCTFHVVEKYNPQTQYYLFTHD